MQAAKDGQPYVVSTVTSSGGSGADGGSGGSGSGADAKAQQADDTAAALQQQLSREELVGGSDSVSRRLRERTVCC